DGAGTVHAVVWTRTGTFPVLAADAPVPVKQIIYSRSTDSGRTWSKPVDVDPGNQSTFRPPLLAADPNSSNLYMTWHSHAEANNTGTAFEGDLNVFFRASLDGGKTWGERKVLNDDATKANQFEPGISVAPNGRVDVAWFDFRNSPTGVTVARGQDDERGASDTYYSSSSDGGRTWTKNVLVSDRSSDRSIGVWSNGFSSRFNMGVASTNDSVYFAWQDSRNGSRETQSEDVYASSLHFDDIAGSTESAGVPSWLLVGAGLAVGMAVSICVAWALARRPTGDVTPVASRT
ncbi:MAG: sialidase family protein, partial [Acidimicrobiales bacterium]|nr:sialidase family protein [Acidimicrobiales bacterium]